MANNILIIPASASIQFSGSAANTIRLVVEDSGSVAFYGDSGSLFGISDSLSGSLMSVNDISGFPILEVTSDDTVTMGTWNQNTLVVTGSLVGIRNSTPTHELSVTGDISASGDVTASAFIGDGSQVTGVISSSYALTASYAANGGGGGGVTINNNTDNYLVTATGTADTLDGEQNLQFDGSKLTVSGDVGITGSLLMQATTAGANDMITLTSGSQQGIIRIGNGNFEFKGTSSGLRFEANNGTEVFYNGLQFTSNNEHQLGNNGSRWGRLYVTDVSSSGEVSASSFIGDGSNITGVVSSSHAVTADSASYVDGLISFPNGLDVTGSLLVDGDISASGDVTASNAYLSNLLTLQSIDPLPTTPSVTGSIAVSSSGATEKLYFHDGSAWKEVSFV